MAGDVFFDSAVRSALDGLRGLTEEAHDELGNSMGAGGSHARRWEALEELVHRHGNRQETAAALTFRGYRGGPEHLQMNQDAALLVRPFAPQKSAASREKQSATNDSVNDDEDDDPVLMQVFGVFDGHGAMGEAVSEFAATELPAILADKLRPLDLQPDFKEEWIPKVRNAITETFVEINQEAPSIQTSGTTASIILQLHDTLFVANTGDSSCFVAATANGLEQVIYSSRLDTPNVEEELHRIEAAGGIVYIPPHHHHGDVPRVVLPSSNDDNHNTPKMSLTTSRSLGDAPLEKVGVIPNPTIEVLQVSNIVQPLQRKRTDAAATADCNDPSGDCSTPDNDGISLFGLCATNGLWKYMSTSWMAKIRRGLHDDRHHHDHPHLFTAVEDLMVYAAHGWFEDFGSSYRDDMTLVVSQLSLSNTVAAALDKTATTTTTTTPEPTTHPAMMDDSL